MTKDFKEGLIMFAGGFLLFWLLKPVVFPATATMLPPIDEATKTSAAQVIDAYKNAVNAGESQAALAELNAYMKEQTGLQVQRKIDGTYVAINSAGQLITV